MSAIDKKAQIYVVFNEDGSLKVRFSLKDLIWIHGVGTTVEDAFKDWKERYSKAFEDGFTDFPWAELDPRAQAARKRMKRVP